MERIHEVIGPTYSVISLCGVDTEMSTAANDDARLDFRLPGELKQIIEQAAAYSGQTIDEFAVSALVRTAHEVIQQHDRTELSIRDRQVFLAMLDDLDAEPNEALRAAAEQYKQQMS